MRKSILPVALLLALAGCNAATGPALQTSLAKREGTKVTFSEEEYGVAASPRVTLAATGLPKGGGHHKIGKPYQIRGLWYVPKEEPGYDRSGKASWYGPKFHGRKTANGEVFDQQHLSAAHTTFPLPSYARVTNLANGRSVIVRVNDRGPYSHSRIIDVSKKAAEVLKFKRAGTANVRVEYVGPAPLEGDDTAKLMSSLREGPGEDPVTVAGAPTMAFADAPATAMPALRPAALVGSSAENLRGTR